MIVFAACLEAVAQTLWHEQLDGGDPTLADKNYRHRQLICLARLLQSPDGGLDPGLFERALYHVVNPRWAGGPTGLQLLALLLDANFATTSFVTAFGHVGVEVALSLLPRLDGETALRCDLMARLRACRAAFRRLKCLAVRVKARAGDRGRLLTELAYRPPHKSFQGGIFYIEGHDRYTAGRAAARGGLS
jgi:hypothetical protein